MLQLLSVALVFVPMVLLHLAVLCSCVLTLASVCGPDTQPAVAAALRFVRDGARRASGLDGDGVVVGRGFVAFVSCSVTDTQVGSSRCFSVHVVLSRAARARFVAAAARADSGDATLLERVSPHLGDYELAPRRARVPAAPWPRQRDALDQILDAIDKRRRCDSFDGLVVVLSGPVGSGKSELAGLLARALAAGGRQPTLYLDFDPTEEGTTLAIHCAKAAPCAARPHVLLWNEWDAGVRRALHGAAAESRLRRGVGDLTSHNNLLDDVPRRDDLVLLLTTNCSRAQIDALHPSAARDGRVHLWITMQ